MMSELATPGSFVDHPRGYRLPDATHVGAVRLQVANLDRSLEWYDRVLGLRASRAGGGTADLTPVGNASPLVHLVERPGATPSGIDRRLGLYHYAILLPRRSALGAFVRHLGESGAHAGASDHVVSEAFYLHDPDGLGIEVYADRPRATWQRVGRQLVMGSDPINIESLLLAAEGTEWTGMPAETRMGHMHLHVGDLAAGAAFFSEGLGLDRIVSRYPGALFMSAGGYHHHLGTNTWAGPHARSPHDGDARLLEWTLVVPSPTDVDAVAANVAGAGFTVKRESGTALADDPWGTAVRVRAESA